MMMIFSSWFTTLNAGERIRSWQSLSFDSMVDLPASDKRRMCRFHLSQSTFPAVITRALMCLRHLLASFGRSWNTFIPCWFALRVHSFFHMSAFQAIRFKPIIFKPILTKLVFKSKMFSLPTPLQISPKFILIFLKGYSYSLCSYFQNTFFTSHAFIITYFTYSIKGVK